VFWGLFRVLTTIWSWTFVVFWLVCATVKLWATWTPRSFVCFSILYTSTGWEEVRVFFPFVFRLLQYWLCYGGSPVIFFFRLNGLNGGARVTMIPLGRRGRGGCEWEWEWECWVVWCVVWCARTEGDGHARAFALQFPPWQSLSSLCETAALFGTFGCFNSIQVLLTRERMGQFRGLRRCPG
jgi:hypothetical protein